MKTILKPFFLAAASVSVIGAAALPVVRAEAALPVFDPTNYAQNLLQAARALEQINHQVQSLQNEAAMLQNMARNLSRIDFPEASRIKSALERVETLMGEARGIDFRTETLDQRFRALFPRELDAALKRDRRLAAAKDRLESAMESFRNSMTVQAQVVENVREDASLLAALSARSQLSEGSLQAQQATNQLLALATKQQLQLQTLMAAEYRSQGLERARRAQAESEARAATRRFLGAGRAYTRQ
jgi:P-type conjugative transfer protein TrbJ